MDGEGQEIAGLCDPNGHAIYVDVRHEVEATLLHEVCHAEILEAGFHQRSDWHPDVEEQLVECLSQGLAHAFTFRKKPS